MKATIIFRFYLGHVGMTARHSNSFKVSVNTEPQAIVRYQITCVMVWLLSNCFYSGSNFVYHNWDVHKFISHCLIPLAPSDEPVAYKERWAKSGVKQA